LLLPAQLAGLATELRLADIIEHARVVQRIDARDVDLVALLAAEVLDDVAALGLHRGIRGELEHEGVRPLAALQLVLAAGAEEDVVAGTRLDVVLATLAEDDVVALGALDLAAAGLAEDGRLQHVFHHDREHLGGRVAASVADGDRDLVAG